MQTWQERIGALCGGTTIDAMVAWCASQGWAWTLGNTDWEDEAARGVVGPFAWVHIVEDGEVWDGECVQADDPGEALGRAILASVETRDRWREADEEDGEPTEQAATLAALGETG